MQTLKITKFYANPEDYPAVGRLQQEAIRKGDDMISTEVTVCRKDGRVLPVELTGTFFREDGKLSQITAFIRDISERKQAEEALRESERNIRLLLDSTAEAIYGLDVDGDCTFANPACIRLLGYETTDDLCGKNMHNLIHHSYPDGSPYPREECLIYQAFQKGEGVHVTDEVLWRTDGTHFPVEYWSYPIHRDERVVGAVVTFLDITERKLAEEELSKSEEKYRSLVDNSIVGVFTTTIDGRLTFVNDAIVRMFDFDNPEQMIAHGSLERWSDIKDRERMLAELQKHGRVTNFEAETITHTDRHIHILFSAKQLDNTIIGMMMDITKRKKAEQKIIDYQQRLKALASQLTIAEEKERHAIAADLHDHVGQTLALARMQLASACKSTNDSKLTDKLDDISDTLLKSIVDTRQLMFELSSSTMHEIGLSSAVSEWLELQVESRHGLKTEFIDNIPDDRRKKMDTDIRTILFRNVRELVVNVVKHARANKVSVRLEDRSPSIRIIVEDDGIGFDPGAATQAGSKTGGFGLFSIQELMADLRGSLRIVSEPGKGCTAILSAPFGKEME